MGHKGQSKGFYQYIKSIWKTHKLNKNEFHLNIYVNHVSSIKETVDFGISITSTSM